MHIIDSDKVKYHGLKGYSEEYKRGYFDAMAAQDDTPTIVENIKIMSPHQTEAITLFYNFDTTKIEDISNLVNYLGEKFHENTVIALPDKVSLESCSKDVLENIISMIAVIIEQL